MGIGRHAGCVGEDDAHQRHGAERDSTNLLLDEDLAISRLQRMGSGWGRLGEGKIQMAAVVCYFPGNKLLASCNHSSAAGDVVGNIYFRLFVYNIHYLSLSRT